jgi:hypothetical protein
LVNVILEIALYSYMTINFDYLMASLTDSYREVAPEKLKTLFIEGSIMDIIVNTWMYFTAYRALSQHKVTIFNHFIWLLLASVFTRILISYLNM